MRARPQCQGAGGGTQGPKLDADHKRHTWVAFASHVGHMWDTSVAKGLCVAWLDVSILDGLCMLVKVLRLSQSLNCSVAQPVNVACQCSVSESLPEALCLSLSQLLSLEIVSQPLKFPTPQFFSNQSPHPARFSYSQPLPICRAACLSSHTMCAVVCRVGRPTTES